MRRGVEEEDPKSSETRRGLSQQQSLIQCTQIISGEKGAGAVGSCIEEEEVLFGAPNHPILDERQFHFTSSKDSDHHRIYKDLGI